MHRTREREDPRFDLQGADDAALCFNLTHLYYLTRSTRLIWHIYAYSTVHMEYVIYYHLGPYR